MPEVSKEDGEKVMRILMALRGLENKKHLEEWESGQLKVLPKKLNLQGTVQAWRKAVKAGARWNNEVQGAREMADGVAAELRQTTKLLEIHCPTCNVSHEVAKMKLVSKTGGFSNLKCKAGRCGQTASSIEWRCRCNRMWTRFGGLVNLRRGLGA